MAVIDKMAEQQTKYASMIDLDICDGEVCPCYGCIIMSAADRKLQETCYPKSSGVSHGLIERG